MTDISTAAPVAPSAADKAAVMSENMWEQRIVALILPIATFLAARYGFNDSAIVQAVVQGVGLLGGVLIYAGHGISRVKVKGGIAQSKVVRYAENVVHEVEGLKSEFEPIIAEVEKIGEVAHLLDTVNDIEGRLGAVEKAIPAADKDAILSVLREVVPANAQALLGISPAPAAPAAAPAVAPEASNAVRGVPVAQPAPAAPAAPAAPVAPAPAAAATITRAEAKAAGAPDSVNEWNGRQIVG